MPKNYPMIQEATGDCSLERRLAGKIGGGAAPAPLEATGRAEKNGQSHLGRPVGRPSLSGPGCPEALPYPRPKRSWYIMPPKPLI